MSLHPNTVQYGPQNIQMKAPQNNLLLMKKYSFYLIFIKTPEP